MSMARLGFWSTDGGRRRISQFGLIRNHVAIKIALELQKLLVDNSLLDVSQSDLEANLFKLMEQQGYGEEYINRYKMMTRFPHQRVPLDILVWDCTQNREFFELFE